jgi:hypothetical protein
MFKAILIKIPKTFHTEIEKAMVKYMWKHKRPQIDKAILSKKSITIPNPKLYYRSMTIKQHGMGTKSNMKTNGSDRRPRHKPIHL